MPTTTEQASQITGTLASHRPSRRRGVLLGSGVLIALAVVGARAQKQFTPGPDIPTVDARPLLKTAAADLDQRIAQFKPVRMPFDATALSANEKQMIDQ